jgi:hypothetical protein
MASGSTPDEAQTFQLSRRQIFSCFSGIRASAGRLRTLKAGCGKGKQPETADLAGHRAADLGRSPVSIIGIPQLIAGVG